MVEYMNAIKKPFTDVKTLVIGIILGLIPIVNWLVTGYAVNVSRMVQKGDKKLPAWDTSKIVEYIVDFIKIAVVEIVYLIPAGIVFAVGGATMLLPLLSGDMNAVMAGLLGAGLIIMIAVVLALIGLIFASMGIQFMIKENKIGSAFKLSAILKKVLTAKYWISVIVLLVYYFVLGLVFMVLSFIPLIGSLIGMGLLGFAGSTTMMTVMAEVFNETK